MHTHTARPVGCTASRLPPSARPQKRPISHLLRPAPVPNPTLTPLSPQGWDAREPVAPRRPLPVSARPRLPSRRPARGNVAAHFRFSPPRVEQPIFFPGPARHAGANPYPIDRPQALPQPPQPLEARGPRSPQHATCRRPAACAHPLPLLPLPLATAPLNPWNPGGPPDRGYPVYQLTLRSECRQRRARGPGGGWEGRGEARTGRRARAAPAFRSGPVRRRRQDACVRRRSGRCRGGRGPRTKLGGVPTVAVAGAERPGGRGVPGQGGSGRGRGAPDRGCTWPLGAGGAR
jgi:hypothetical protein